MERWRFSLDRPEADPEGREETAVCRPVVLTARKKRKPAAAGRDELPGAEADL
jgi:hypothetical protein